MLVKIDSLIKLLRVPPTKKYGDSMIHKMNLWDESFQKIKNKTKTIEMRLCDEKRSLISIGEAS